MKLEKLISIDTQNPGTDYKKMTAFLLRELLLRGAKIRKIGNNVLAVWGKPQLMINAHIDTVKATGWKKNPLIPVSGKSRIAGLGASDNKGNIYCIFAAIDAIKKPKHLALLLSVDEEYGTTSGVSACLKSSLSKSGIKRVVVLEPTENKIITKHPAYYSFWLTFTCVPAHSSTQSENAILKAAHVLCKLSEFNVGSITSSNSAANILAGECKVKVSIRTYQSHDKILSRLAKIAGGALIEPSFIGPSFINTDSFLPSDGSVDFWTEASLFCDAGFNTVLYGAGSITQAHKPDEFVTIKSLNSCILFLKRLIGEYS